MSTPALAPQRPRTRISWLRVLVVLVCTVAVSWGGYRTVSAAVTQLDEPDPAVFAAYVDVTAWPPYPFETPSGPEEANVVLSFVVADPERGCAPSWGGYYSLDEAASEIELDRRVSQLRLTGGQARVSFGGQLGTELGTACTDTEDLVDAYQEVIDRYELTSIDLDLEGATLQDVEGSERRAEAIRQIQEEAAAADESLAVWLTLPVAPTGLTAEGLAAVTTMLAAGVDVAGVNGMTMDFGVVTSESAPLSDVVVEASKALHGQVRAAFADAGQSLSENDAWAKVGITPMIGQSDVATEVFTVEDAEVVNQFAQDVAVGQVAMWSLNRDSTCTAPLPTVLTVVQTSCSGIDQGASRFAEVLSADLASRPAVPAPESAPSASPAVVPAPSTGPAGEVVDDPETSPFPIWDPLGTYPGGTKIVWQKQVYQARYWTSGVTPGAAGAGGDAPWTLVGPVLPGDTPAPLPTLPEGTYPAWDPEEPYTAGTRVLLDGVPYEAKWWSQGQEPGTPVQGGSPWVLIHPGA
ncbi:glycosyl hydrolase family 18 [Actinotalea sp. BY-33]|uniref:Glycosyl hydrolase family 18 n=1 Tax=Actinotalea soli TaxID=2819234 RepID=A0A939LR39_9CELL|nr:carbohydrate-binding protein [Actinotalea soli]MBO1751490.1 glycosyl hydrolase family 18 [Actinotalea soli]